MESGEMAVRSGKEWARWAQEATATEKRRAQEEYTKRVGASLKSDCEYLLRETRYRVELLRSGEGPEMFGEFDRDTMARIFNDTIDASYTEYECPEDLPAGPLTREEAAIEECAMCLIPEEAEARAEFIEGFQDYLYFAAAYAKAIGSVRAMRMYLLAWGIFREYGRWQEDLRTLTLSPDDALKAVAYEKIATQKLWVDAMARKLPSVEVK